MTLLILMSVYKLRDARELRRMPFLTTSSSNFNIPPLIPPQRHLVPTVPPLLEVAPQRGRECPAPSEFSSSLSVSSDTLRLYSLGSAAGQAGAPWRSSSLVRTAVSTTTF